MAKQQKINNSSVIMQTGKSQDGGDKKCKNAKFCEKRILLTPWYAHVAVNPEIRSILIF